jgi:hypothetical protein
MAEAIPEHTSSPPSVTWLPLDEAVVRVERILGSRQLALHDVQEALRGDRLRSYARVMEKDRERERGEVGESFWRGLALTDRRWTEKRGVWVRPIDARYVFTGQWFFFVGAEDLERLWPGTAPPASSLAVNDLNRAGEADKTAPTKNAVAPPPVSNADLHGFLTRYVASKEKGDPELGTDALVAAANKQFSKHTVTRERIRVWVRTQMDETKRFQRGKAKNQIAAEK